MKGTGQVTMEQLVTGIAASVSRAIDQVEKHEVALLARSQGGH
ncbi:MULTISPECIES: hypothetical protein [Candidatus Accumulibacter]|uniref:Uncharacterized protein n=2 Tax=Candidatus Accumulibacter TaxID=327159 RepID=A0A080M780_9PROT|nr:MULTISPECIES: hypothetical protein [Candidatus Accumulibacter]KFB77083.1 MAG: hypothetical protein AW06_001815 [Candidatus Accumulibacter cognatus]TMQ75466.1 hypothetical protein ACCUM_1268 [Candidatus Accumulibacter phosphatis]HNC21056.1 hypothetical protein [Accumulibacter sp.]